MASKECTLENFFGGKNQGRKKSPRGRSAKTKGTIPGTIPIVCKPRQTKSNEPLLIVNSRPMRGSVRLRAWGHCTRESKRTQGQRQEPATPICDKCRGGCCPLVWTIVNHLERKCWVPTQGNSCSFSSPSLLSPTQVSWSHVVVHVLFIQLVSCVLPKQMCRSCVCVFEVLFSMFSPCPVVNPCRLLIVSTFLDATSSSSLNDHRCILPHQVDTVNLECRCR